MEELNFEVPSGCNVIICGPNGCGKSSLFRILGGVSFAGYSMEDSFAKLSSLAPAVASIWWHSDQTAAIEAFLRSSGESAPSFHRYAQFPNFIPTLQRPYMTLGTLRDQIIYPDTFNLMKSKGSKDDDLLVFLEKVN